MIISVFSAALRIFYTAIQNKGKSQKLCFCRGKLNCSVVRIDVILYTPDYFIRVWAVIVEQPWNILRPIDNCRHFADDIFKCIFLNENYEWRVRFHWGLLKINNTIALVQIMALHPRGDKPLSEPMIVSLLTHICVNLLQRVKQLFMWICIP